MALLVDTGQTRVYASSPADATMSLTGVDSGTETTFVYAPWAGAALTVWTMPEAGDQVVDGLYTMGESPIADGIITSDDTGEVRFRGSALLPEELWLQTPDGTRYRVFGGVQESLNELRTLVSEGSGGGWDETRIADIESRLTALEVGGGGGTSAVSSVNGRTGAVVLAAIDVGAVASVNGVNPTTGDAGHIEVTSDDIDGLTATLEAKAPLVDGVVPFANLPIHKGDTPPADTTHVWVDTSGAA